jgi:hypothetical protein
MSFRAARSWFRMAAFLVAFSAVARSTAAQSSIAPHGPLFGGDAPSSPRSLDMTASIYQGHDDDFNADTGAGGSPFQSHIGGQYSEFDSSLRLTETRPRFSIVSSANGSARRYPELASVVGSNAAATTDLNVALGRKTSLRAGIAGSYVSAYAFDTFVQRTQTDRPIGSTGGVDDASLDWTRTTYGGTVQLTRAVTKRNTFSVLVGAGHSERRVLQQSSDEKSVAAIFGRSFGRDLVFRTIYTFHDGLQEIGEQVNPLRTQDLQLSGERSWRHSPFRRTLLSISGGPSLLQQRTIGPVPTDPEVVRQDETERLFRFVGTFTLAHDVTRTWSAQAWYRRGAGVRDAVFFSNTGGLDIRGRIGRRVTTTLSGGYTDGDIGIGFIQQSRYGTTFGAARLQVALTRFAALNGQYFIYRYGFGPGAEVPEGFLSSVDRHGLQVGITLWAPVQTRTGQ